MATNEIEHDLDVNPDEGGTFLVHSKNKKRLLCDGLMEKFSTYGKIAAVCDSGNKGVNIRFLEKESALKCYYDLHKNVDFMVELPHKKKKEVDMTDSYLESALSSEMNICFQKGASKDAIDEDENGISKSPIYHICSSRKIIKAEAFRRFIITVNAMHQSSKREFRDFISLFTELKYNMQGVSLNFETGFDKISERDDQNGIIHNLVLAKDFFYYQRAVKIHSIDVLICNLPSWYQQIDAFKFIQPIVSDDLLQIDWYRMYPPGTSNYSFPYGIIHLKTHRSASLLMYCADEVVIDSHKVAIFLMDSVEDILLEFRDRL